MSWQKVKLGEIADCSLGKMLDHKKNVGELHPYLANFNVQWGRIDLSEVGEMPFKPEELKRYKLEKGDLLVCEGGESGRCAMWNGQVKDMMYQKALHRLRVKSGLCSSGYLYFWFLCNGKSDYFRQFTTGATILHLPLQNLVEISVSLPPLPIQRKIADVLGAYDELIENNRKRIALLEKMARELYRERFVNFQHWGGVCPKGIQRATLGDLVSRISTGLNPRKNFILGRGNNFYVTIKNMVNNTVLLDTKCDRVDDEALVRINRRSDLRAGDLLFSSIGTIGRVALVHEHPYNWNTSESVFNLRPSARISSEYLYFVLVSDSTQAYAESHALGVAQRGIRMADLKQCPVLLPDAIMVSEFTRLVRPLLSGQHKLRQLIDNLARQRDRLLPRLMSGKIDVEKLVKEGK